VWQLGRRILARREILIDSSAPVDPVAVLTLTDFDYAAKRCPVEWNMSLAFALHVGVPR
jgi:hypothetical protein